MIIPTLYLVNYASIMSAMCLDNIFWIPADRQWFGRNSKLKPHFRVLIVKGKEYIFPKDKEALSFIWNRRIKEVLKHPYDIVPAMMMSALLTLIQLGLIQIIL